MKATQKNKPDWNSNLNENPHKASHAEVLQRKLNSMSKNRQLARDEWLQKQDQLKKGKIEGQYKEIIDLKKKKTFTSRAAFISDKTKAKEYENRAYTQDKHFGS